MYQSDGVKVCLNRGIWTIVPWDRMKTVMRDGKVWIRRELLIREGFKGVLPTRGLGRITKQDAGKMLVVDNYPNGDQVDYLVNLPPISCGLPRRR